MKSTINIKVKTSSSDKKNLTALMVAYTDACNQISPYAHEHRCSNRVALHKAAYSSVRSSSLLGSQMVCNAIFSVYKAYKSNKAKKKVLDRPVLFRKNGSVHFDKRTYMLNRRVKLHLNIGRYQMDYLEKGLLKEAELTLKKGEWYFHLILSCQIRLEQKGIFFLQWTLMKTTLQQ